MDNDFTKLPRVYIERNLSANAMVALEEATAHYLRNVLRRRSGDSLRLFNGHGGEWLAEISDLGKKDGWLAVKDLIREQPGQGPPAHLLFTPIKKDRMDFLIEKAVELGVSDLHPVITARTEVRKINEDRLTAQIIEAAEQCERMDIPVLHPIADLRQKTGAWGNNIPILWCRERGNPPHISLEQEDSDGAAFLIGPEGGFDDSESDFLLAQAAIRPVSLGESILRTETAALLALGYAKLKGQR